VAWLAELNARATLTEQRLADLKAMLDEMRTERDACRGSSRNFFRNKSPCDA
jgi:sulfur transfer protein SufE